MRKWPLLLIRLDGTLLLLTKTASRAALPARIQVPIAVAAPKPWYLSPVDRVLTERTTPPVHVVAARILARVPLPSRIEIPHATSSERYGEKPLHVIKEFKKTLDRIGDKELVDGKETWVLRGYEKRLDDDRLLPKSREDLLGLLS